VIVLALETATRSGSAALWIDGALRAAAAGDPARTHASRLPDDVLALLEGQGLRLDQVDLLSVCLGPGGFTGLRVGIATMQGLAFATGIPIAGISALDALALAAARNLSSGTVGVWMDAARKEVFAGRYVPATAPLGVAAVSPAVSAAPEAVLAQWDAAGPAVTHWTGDGTTPYRDLIAARDPNAVFLPTPMLAPLVAEAAIRLGGIAAAGPPHALRPVYVRRPDAEIARDVRAADARAGC
jgi:tRNA threonylcarbamoyladenosine biosynthesis protein TsaB